MPDQDTYRQRRNAGLCARCGTAASLAYSVVCEACATAQRAYAWMVYHRRVLGEAVTQDDYHSRKRRAQGAGDDGAL